MSNSGVGSFTYTPPPNWSGTDWFDYTVGDGVATDEATVIVVVVPVNDAPVAGDDPDLNDNPAAFQVAVMGTLHIPPAVLLDDDTDQEGDPLTLSALGPVATTRGSVQCDASGCTYTRSAAGTASDAFTYTVTDGALSDTATVTVTVAEYLASRVDLVINEIYYNEAAAGEAAVEI